MRIASSSISDTIVQQLQQLNAQQTKLQNQVGSGLRISQPEDDPAAVARVINLNGENSALNQFIANTDRALQVSQATYSGLQQLKKISDRATEIGTLGSGAQTPAALQAYAAELDQLIEQAVQLANGKLGNDYLFGGKAVDTKPYAVTTDAQGRVASVSQDPACASDPIQIPLTETSRISPGAEAATTAGLRDFIGHLVSLRGAMETGNAAAMSAAQDGLLATEDVFISALSQQGAVQMRIEVNQNQLKDRAQNIAQLISSETSADLTTTVVKLSQTQTAYQAALQSASMIMKKSLLDYIN